ncbi:hypothetical protein R3I93_005998 [Phoxinus phoxinus]|uniref:Uncharacterized protein n=1 Tax=Phoxinus phoxinus TaxID=58324 RepID=A0AAN9H919_9TELE
MRRGLSKAGHPPLVGHRNVLYSSSSPHIRFIREHTDWLHPWLPSDVIKLPCGCHTSWVDCGECWHPFPV